MTFEEISIRCGESVATVAPARGALCTGLKVKGRDVLYFDPQTLESVAGMIRGGIPIMFPHAGKLNDDRFEQAGTVMHKHGFARNKRWRVTEYGSDRLRMVLDRDEETRTAFPFSYNLEQSYIALPTGLQVELMLINLMDAPIPIAPGWHPYFQCPSGMKHLVKSEDLDNLPPGSLNNDTEFDFGVNPPLNGRVKFSMPQLGTMLLSFSPEFRHLHFWSKPGQNFICIEPFTGPPNALNVSSQRLLIPPHQARVLTMKIEMLELSAGEEDAPAADSKDSLDDVLTQDVAREPKAYGDSREEKVDNI